MYEHVHNINLNPNENFRSRNSFPRQRGIEIISCLFYSHVQYGAVPLGIAAQNGHTKIVQRLLGAGANVNHQHKVVTVNVQLPCKK